jgi:hypothetical protein
MSKVSDTLLSMLDKVCSKPTACTPVSLKADSSIIRGLQNNSRFVHQPVNVRTVPTTLTFINGDIVEVRAGQAAFFPVSAAIVHDWTK